MPRLAADIRISLKVRGGKTHRIELIRQPVGRTGATAGLSGSEGNVGHSLLGKPAVPPSRFVLPILLNSTVWSSSRRLWG